MVAGMLVTAISGWVRDGCTESPEDIDRMFRTAANAAVRAGLRPRDR